MTETTRTYVEPILVRVEVLTTKFHSPNRGLSARYSDVAVYPRGTQAEDIENGQLLERAVTIERGNLPGIVIAVPVKRPEDMIGPMASGAYLASNDSRFSRAIEDVLNQGKSVLDEHARFYGALPLHDRWETVEQYRALSS